MKKVPLLKLWSTQGNTDDLTYYKKSKKMVRVIQVLYAVFGFLMIAVKVLVVFILVVIIAQTIASFL